jgi:hypothetical protein
MPVLKFLQIKKALYLRRRNGRVVECGGLENRCPENSGPGVRIPLSPPKASDQSRSFCCGIFVFEKPESGLPE